MYLRINDVRFVAHLTFDKDLELSYTNLPSNYFLDDSIIIDHYVCLFNNEWEIVEEVWEFLQNRLHAKKLAFNTVATKGSDLKLYYDFLHQYKLAYDVITKKHINDFIAWLMLPANHNGLRQLNTKSTRSAKTVNRMVSSIMDFYKYHETINGLSNPFEHVYETIKRPVRQNKSFYSHTQNGLVQKSIFKIKEFDRGIRVLSKEQIETILAACTMQRDKILFELLLFTGMRIGEALSLDIHAIGVSKIGENIQELSMRPNDEDYLKGNRQRQQKTGTRALFIPTLLMEKLSSYYEQTWLSIYEKKEMVHEYFFISEFHNNVGEPLSYQAVWDRCRKIGKKTGIYFTPHDFRHTFATILARNNVGIDRLGKLLGHSYIASTDLYIQIANKEQIVQDLIPFYESYGVVHE